MSKHAKALARNIAALQRESGLNITRFAEKIGITQPNLSRFLNEKARNPTIETLDRIGAPFGKDAVWLLADHASAMPHAHDLAECARRVTEAALRAQSPLILRAAEPSSTPGKDPLDGLSPERREKMLILIEIEKEAEKAEKKSPAKGG